MNKNGNGFNGGAVKLWRGVIATLVVAGIAAGWNGAKQLATTAALLTVVAERLDKHEDRILYLERSRRGAAYHRDSIARDAARPD